eukprot:TRINITY_DN40413_c0_g1_i1.p1 TRINITY_DN40413_c0_g1~~TRINITY_DN40413_c0_g1_i1.p1  ORF type:complete len:326 (-),score=48.05 TRINITY_DN40413_c0_g1_i1:235-1212(-)
MGPLALVASCLVMASVAVRMEDDQGSEHSEESQATKNGNIEEAHTNLIPGLVTQPGAFSSRHAVQMPAHLTSPSIGQAPVLNLDRGAGHLGRLSAARSPAMALRDPEYLPDLAEGVKIFAEVMPKINLGVSDIIRDWTAFAGGQESVARQIGDDKTSSIMAGTQEILSQMRSEIDEVSPDHVFAFTSGEASVEGIKSLATVTTQVLFDDYDSAENWNLAQLAQAQGLVSGQDAIEKGRIEVLNINEIVATPKAREKGVGAELIRRIVGWAKDTGRLVTLAPANDELQEFYEDLGFELIDPYGRQMVYSGFGLEDERAEGFMLDLQ